MSIVTALPVNSVPPNDWWRRVSTAFNLMLGEVADLYRRPTQTITTNYSATTTDFAVIANAINGPVTVTLPSPAQGKEFFAKKIDSTSNAVTLSGPIDGGTSRVLANQWDGVRLFGNTDRWLVA